MAMSRKILENKRRQHTVVLAHKRKLRDEINPHLRAKKQEWSESSKSNKIAIRSKWIAARDGARAQLRKQQLKHKMVISGHKARIRLEIAKRR
ncbi:MAG TPA: hypothetical protein VN455_10855 [Methanotrichaceae archaeon]|nr:hypothetical protein [Methanotrichaceae archaeon]